LDIRKDRCKWRGRKDNSVGSDGVLIADNTGSTGTFALSGGSLNVQGVVYLGYEGIGIFNQSGGVHSASQIYPESRIQSASLDLSRHAKRWQQWIHALGHSRTVLRDFVHCLMWSARGSAPARRLESNIAYMTITPPTDYWTFVLEMDGSLLV